MADERDDQKTSEVAQQIDSLRKVAANGELSDDLLEDVSGGHTDGVTHTDGAHTDGVTHTDSPNVDQLQR